ncbi:mandelate racemase/muconate lactonizing enzyme family protein [Devosia sp. A449]
MVDDGRVIKKIFAAECVIPLQRPVVFKGRRIEARKGVALRLETADGTIGEYYSGTRGTPLLSILELLAPEYLGADSTMIAQLAHDVGHAHVSGKPILMHALSVFDVALWDIAAKSSGLPLFKMLGGLRKQVPMMLVAGYYLNERTIDDVRDEVARYVDAGYAQVKINLSGKDPAFDKKYVEACMKVAEGKLSADAHWSWISLGEALATCTQIDDLGLRFIEDPFGVQEIDMTATLQSQLRTPIAYGEDMTNIYALEKGKFRVFRLGPSACGGVTGSVSALNLARAAGCTVMPHVETLLNGQLAGASRAIEAVEMLGDSTASGSAGLNRKGPNIVDGMLHLDEEPGIGVQLDWDVVGKYTVKNFILEV